MFSDEFIKYFLDRLIIKNEDDCWEWTEGCTDKGVGSLWAGDRPRSVAQVSWMIFKGELPTGKKWHILHTCDNKKCGNYAHLFAGSHEDNMQDMRNKGRGGAQVLSWKEVEEIRADTASTNRALAEKFGVHFCTIADIKHHRTWKGDPPRNAAIKLSDHAEIAVDNTITSQLNTTGA